MREDWKGQLKTGLMVREGLEKPGGDQPGASEGQKAGGLITRGQNSVGWQANTETGVTRVARCEPKVGSGKAECQAPWKGPDKLLARDWGLSRTARVWFGQGLEDLTQLGMNWGLAGHETSAMKPMSVSQRDGLSSGKKPKGQESLEDWFRESGDQMGPRDQSTNTNGKGWEQPRGGWFRSVSVCKDQAKETGDWCAGTEWGCAEGTGEVMDRGLGKSRMLGYKVWARTIKRSTRWVVGVLPPELCQDQFQEVFSRPGKALKLEIQDWQSRPDWYRDSTSVPNGLTRPVKQGVGDRERTKAGSTKDQKEMLGQGHSTRVEDRETEGGWRWEAGQKKEVQSEQDWSGAMRESGNDRPDKGGKTGSGESGGDMPEVTGQTKADKA
ncbi:hypothetical protein F5J12DRAFT_781684 [Pisolithus orientalis]|uniref:uncharacterized protein n=1 Tax=Pisolithus orientalis TaxID=936130 RepID=UPI00222409E3|nr:uncharacterized protein F5J12DRAFT_781684 [Pisolithus orientalis]KAI6010666.1 hypothetical protein F5J12DRAFT_781684 [Pisolithus orientalis]